MTNITLPRELVEKVLEDLQMSISSVQSTYRKSSIADSIKELQSALSQSLTDCHQLKPLTTEQITECWGKADGVRHGYGAFARAIEAAHGIGVTNE